MEIGYRDAAHADLPHVVKFSGGRSSGYLLRAVLDAGLLDAGRGDVVLFNNTSAEHPATYDFVRRAMDAAEAVGVPCFILEYCTYEKRVRGGAWTRLPTFRLARRRPRPEPDGYHHRGEVFEEFLSHRGGMLPNMFIRACTINMKIQPMIRFLQLWLAGADAVPARGHDAGPSQPVAHMLASYRRRGGALPDDVIERIKRYAMGRPAGHVHQAFADYSPPAAAGRPTRTRYVGLLGIRADERRRAERIMQKAAAETNITGGTVEHHYMPLVDAGVETRAVTDYWRGRPDDLDFPAEAGLSNCVHCFLKPPRAIHDAHKNLSPTLRANPALVGTPVDLRWWARLETDYARPPKPGDPERGFFVRDKRTSYRDLLRPAQQLELDMDDQQFACECTD